MTSNILNCVCDNCESEFGIIYTEELCSSEIPTFCPFCSEKLENIDLTEMNDENDEENYDDDDDDDLK